MPRLPLQDEPESTVGRKPGRGFEHRGSEEGTPVRSGASIRLEEGDESEAGTDIRDRDAGDGPEVRGLEE